MLKVSVDNAAIFFFNIILWGKSHKIVLKLSDQCAWNSDTWTQRDRVVSISSKYLLTTLKYRNESRGQLKCDGTRAETRFLLSAKRTTPFKSAGTSAQSTTGSRDVLISGSNAGYIMFWGSVKGTGYPLHSSVSPSLSLPRVTLCHQISIGVYEHCWISLVYSLGSILPRYKSLDRRAH